MSTAIIKANVFVNNCPLNIIQNEATFMVARLIDTDLWYYGIYSTHKRAEEVAEKLGNGVVLEMTED